MSNKQSFLKSGHLPTLFSSFLYFDASFMIWVLLGVTSTFIAADFQLTPYQKGLMVGLPVLGGALLRIPMGLLADRYGGKPMGMIGMIVTMLPLVWGYLLADSVSEVYLLGVLLGVAGASFAVALPLASRWYPPEHQGLAMGIAGAGNSGTVLAAMFGPRLAEQYTWHGVFGMALIPLLVAFLVFLVLARDNPQVKTSQSLRSYLAIVKVRETWLYSFFYSLSFGGFVGMTSYLGLFFVDQYGVSKVSAGDFVTLVVFAGSFIRPIGGWLADRFSGVNLLVLTYFMAAMMLGLVGMLPGSVYSSLGYLFIAMLFFGIANGALFQVIPTRFPEQIGIMTGFVGAAGGVGGFILPNILGTMKGLTGSYSFGFWWIAVTFLVAMAVVMYFRRDWIRQNQVVPEEGVIEHG